MKRLLFRLLLLFTTGMLTLSFSACATTEPGSLESSLLKQDERMKKSTARARDREVARERKWKDYSARADERYDRWIDSVMQ
jgi:uncharacterized protein YxeA